jgi:hypothetical protein
MWNVKTTLVRFLAMSKNYCMLSSVGCRLGTWPGSDLRTSLRGFGALKYDVRHAALVELQKRDQA